MMHSHHTKFPTTENCTANHLVPTNEDPEPYSRSDSSTPNDAVHPAHKMTSDRASTCDITALSDTEENAEPSPTQASRDDFPRVDNRISDCTQPNLNAASQDVEHSMPDSHIQILETKREPDESSKPLHPMCAEPATPNSQLTPEDDIPDFPAADHAHNDPDGPVMVHATDSHIPTTTMAPTNEITHEPLPDDRISSTITSMAQASDPVNNGTPPAETHYIHKLSAAKVEEHQKHAIASWNDIATDIQNISAEITQLLCTYAKYGRWHVKNEELAQTHGRPNCPGRQQHIAADPSQTDPTWSLYRSRDAQSRPRTTTGRTVRTTVLRTVWTRGHCPHRSTFEQRETFWSFVLAPARSPVHRVPWNLHRRRRPQWSPCPPQSKP